ncbi:MAG: hypothetical protein IKB75_07140 [Clostridia bacterium]|nr:hypothetical protein [Clostridia bacterium]
MRNFIDRVFNNKKATMFIPIIISLLIYVLFIIFGTGEEKNNFIFIIPFISVFWYFGVFLVVYTQIKNPLCPEKFLDFFEFVATIFSSIGAVAFIILALINGMQNVNPQPILSCLTFSSLSWVHSKRNR